MSLAGRVALDSPSVVVVESLNISREVERVPSRYSRGISVTVHGDRSLPAILTYHELGLEHGACFSSFLAAVEETSVFKHFCLYHIDAPGQKDGARDMPDGAPYPTFDQLAEQVAEVAQHFTLTRFIGFGIGMGANILLRAATLFPAMVRALILIGPTSKQMGWLEWSYASAASTYVRYAGMTDKVIHQFLATYLSPEALESNKDLQITLTQHLQRRNLPNLCQLMDSYAARKDFTADLPNVKCDVMMFCGAGSYSIDDTIDLNGEFTGRPDVSYLKLPHTGQLVTQENPLALMEPLSLFFQGLGYTGVRLTPAQVDVSRDAALYPVGSEEYAHREETPAPDFTPSPDKVTEMQAAEATTAL